MFGPLVDALMRNVGCRTFEPVVIAILSLSILGNGGTLSLSMILSLGYEGSSQAMFLPLRGVQVVVKEGSSPSSKRQ